MDEITWLWMYNSWLEDLRENHKTYKDYALFLGAFSNWEMANKISKKENPDFKMSKEEFEASYQRVIESDEDIEEREIGHRRRRRIIK
jgi:PIN domain nuclease of toxin-antitoxin system